MMHLLSHPTTTTAAAAIGAGSTAGRGLLPLDGGELLDTVQRMVEGNGEAFVSLTPHLHSCAGLAGAFVDSVEELQRRRLQATR